MESRRLIKFGKNSHVISLPKGWVEQQKLKKGDELFLEQKPGSIVIMASHCTETEKSAHIACDKQDIGHIQTEITSYYKAGYTTISLECKNFARIADDVKELVHNLAGLEIVEQTRTRMVVKDLIDVRQIAPLTLINRTDMMVRSMFQDALNKEGVSADVLRSRDKDVNRLQLLLTRTMWSLLENPALSNVLNVSVPTAYNLDRVAWSLERIGDYLKRADGDINRADPEAQTRLRTYLKDIYDVYLATMKTYSRLDRGAAIDIHQDIIARLNQFTRIVHKATQKDELLALENTKNILRDLRMILRATIEISQESKTQSTAMKTSQSRSSTHHVVDCV